MFHRLVITLVFASITSLSLGQTSSTEPTHWQKPITSVDSPAPNQTSETAMGGSGFPRLDLQSETGEASKPESIKSSFSGPTVTVTSSLAIVLGLFAAMIWATRRFNGRGSIRGILPKEIMQPLGSTTLDPRTRVSMLRCGDRIIVIAQSASGIHPLSEITDPIEVQRLTAACLGDSKQTFASTLNDIEREPINRGFVGQADQPTKTNRQKKSSRLFATA